MPSRLALFVCPCCEGQTTIPLEPRRRAADKVDCRNGGCWSCMGVCRGEAERVELLVAC